jgi:hypothetical protein
MIHRMLLALGTMLLVAGTAFAQTVDDTSTTLPPPSASEDASSAEVAWREASSEGTASTARFWATADYLLGWFQGDRLPALVTTSRPGTPLTGAGILGLPTTTTLFGNSSVNDTVRSGYYVELGWCRPDQELGVEAGFRLLQSQATSFAAASNGSVILAQPFIDATTNLPQAATIAFPGRSGGTLNIHVASGNFYEAHIDLSENQLDMDGFRCETLLGYRYFHYEETLRNQATIAAQGAPFVPGTHLASDDGFGTRNNFNGLEFGLRSQIVQDNLSVDLLAKLAVGQLYQDVNIAGNTLVSVPSMPPVVQAGGLYALVSNIGRHTGHKIAVLPEFGITLGWQATQRIRLTVGYTLLLLSDIARAADQIDQTINPAFLPPPMQTPTLTDRPAFRLIRSDATLQSINLGMDFIY